jgi:hypothetical protein
MRTNIEIDDALLAEAMAATGLKTKRKVVEAGLRLLARHKRQAGARKLFAGVRRPFSLAAGPHHFGRQRLPLRLRRPGLVKRSRIASARGWSLRKRRYQTALTWREPEQQPQHSGLFRMDTGRSQPVSFLTRDLRDPLLSELRELNEVAKVVHAA